MEFGFSASEYHIFKIVKYIVMLVSLMCLLKVFVFLDLKYTEVDTIIRIHFIKNLFFIKEIN